MDENKKADIASQLEQCMKLLDTSGVNSKQIVKNTLKDIIGELRDERNTESGLPF